MNLLCSFCFSLLHKKNVIWDIRDKYRVKNIPGTFLDRLEEVVVLVVHSHHNQEILRHKLKYLRHCHNKKLL